jgi:hypothetical protein
MVNGRTPVNKKPVPIYEEVGRTNAVFNHPVRTGGAPPFHSSKMGESSRYASLGDFAKRGRVLREITFREFSRASRSEFSVTSRAFSEAIRPIWVRVVDAGCGDAGFCGNRSRIRTAAKVVVAICSKPALSGIDRPFVKAEVFRKLTEF